MKGSLRRATALVDVTGDKLADVFGAREIATVPIDEVPRVASLRAQ